MESVHWHPPVLSITNSGFRPGGSVSALKQMQQNYSAWSLKIYAICVQVREKAVEKHCRARCQLPGVLQVWKSSTIMHCCTQLSEAFLNDCFAWSCSTEAPRHTNGCHLQAVTTWHEIFYGDFIKVHMHIKKTTQKTKLFQPWLCFYWLLQW